LTVTYLIPLFNFPGGNGGGVTPVPIPNTVVKPSSADGTAVFLWESRTLPGFFISRVLLYNLKYSSLFTHFMGQSVNG
jgi:hypothetical protein